MYKELVSTLAWEGCHSWLVILGLQERRLSDFTQTIHAKNNDIRLKLKCFQTKNITKHTEYPVLKREKLLKVVFWEFSKIKITLVPVEMHDRLSNLR